MKNLEELIQLRKSNKFHNIGVNVESVIEVVKKSYYNFEKHSVPSAGAIYGLKVLLFYKNNKKIFNSKGEISTEKFEINQLTQLVKLLTRFILLMKCICFQQGLLMHF